LQFDIEVGARVRRVVVTRVGDGFAVDVDGRHREVDAVRVDAKTLSLIVDRAWHYDTVMVPGPVGAGLVVHVGTVPVSVTLNGRRRHLAGHEVAAGTGSVRIVTPMAGKVVTVRVALGDVVTAGQAVAVVEAMKMENDIRANRDGVVAEIHARQGMSVDAGALLVVIR